MDFESNFYYLEEKLKTDNNAKNILRFNGNDITLQSLTKRSKQESVCAERRKQRHVSLLYKLYNKFKTNNEKGNSIACDGSMSVPDTC